MDLDRFLAFEKRRLAEERQSLYERSQELNSSTSEINTTPSMIRANEKNNHHPTPHAEATILNKKTKDWINKQHNNNNKSTEEDVATSSSNRRKNKNQDDMEQWVSDTFYSYFPGFSNEYQKRQNELQKRQRENQENLIKHQMLNTGHSRKKKHLHMETSNINSARSNNSSVTSNGANGSMHGAAKTDMEIINVNNPNYVPSKHSSNSVRPDSARYRMLQDLRHTNLTNLVNGTEDAMEINRKQAEIDSARKKEYQRELMQQIEDKRRTIKLLRDKEHEQEQVLTRRLQEQLRTMKLEEQLEKERLKAVKVRFDAEQNRLSREHLLAKLENDSQLLLNADLNAISNKNPAISNETNKENISNRQDNKVYKYFSNSEKHDYSYRNKSSSLPTEIELELDQTEMAKIERECFHLSEKICPMCDEPLKELKNFCLRCQSKISFRIKSPSTGKNTTKHFISKHSKSNGDDTDKNSEQHETEADRSFFLVCIRCERLYSWCKTCTNKSDVCKACQNRRNLCMSCRKTLCSFCLEEVACGKDAETLHINDSVGVVENETIKNNETVKAMSFRFMDDNRESGRNDNKSSNISSLSPIYSSLNNLDYINHPPYSINIATNSVFHPDNKPFSLFSTNEDKNSKTLQNDGENNLSIYDNEHILSTSNSDEKNMERLRRDTDKRLSRYLKNYGELAYQTRGTQTTPTSTGRRDVVIQGEHSLSIPLLREMPKMTRMEAVKFKGNSKELEDLQRRWDIPAVQKYTISPASPKVVTQVGAIRKQLQIERIFSEDADS